MLSAIFEQYRELNLNRSRLQLLMINQYHHLNLSSLVSIEWTTSYVHTSSQMDAEEKEFDLDMDIVEAPLS